MNRRMWITPVLLAPTAALALLAAAPGKERDQAAAAPGTAVETAGEPERSLRPLSAAALTPMHREILEASEGERSRVEELSLRFHRAVDHEERLAIQQEIEATKRSGTIAILEIQLRYALAGGRAEVAGQLAAALDAVRNPKLLPAAGRPTMLEREGRK